MAALLVTINLLALGGLQDILYFAIWAARAGVNIRSVWVFDFNMGIGVASEKENLRVSL